MAHAPSFLPLDLAARPPVLLNEIYREVLNFQTPGLAYRDHFGAFIRQGIRLGLLDVRLGDLALGYLSDVLDPERDKLFDVADLEVLNTRYLLRNQAQHLLELPQWFWLRIAMGLSLEYDQPEVQALFLYDSLSRLQLPEQTRSLAAAGTVGRASLHLIDDELRRMLNQPAIELKRPAEPILMPTREPFAGFASGQSAVWNLYKQAQACFWTPEAVDLVRDQQDWKARLNDDERYFLKHVLGFLAASESLINDNLASNFMREVQDPEARCFYGFQIMTENIHAETYGLLLKTYLPDPAEKNHLLRALETLPGIQRKADWARRWLEQGSFAERLVAFAAIEGLFFAGSFCALFWIQQRGLLPGLSLCNRLIARDESLHTAFACLLYSQLQQQLAPELLSNLIAEAVTIEQAFISQELPVDLIGLDVGLMTQYIEYEADRLLLALGAGKLYHAANPFDFLPVNLESA